MENLSIYMAQLNPTVGAIEHNVALIRGAYGEAVNLGADLVLTPELSVVGYPPEDLILKPFFQRSAIAAVEELATLTTGEGSPGLLVGSPWLQNGILYNAAILLADGKIQDVTLKSHLPNYGVFDEIRVFASGGRPHPMEFRGVKLGVLICEDMWFDDCARTLTELGAEILLVPTCSPYDEGKEAERRHQAQKRVHETGLPLLFCNQLGGQDELVFDGASFAMAGDGAITMQMKRWQEYGVLVEVLGGAPVGSEIDPDEDRMLSIYQAMVTGVRDYVRKNKFPGVLIGLSGGIDSALSAAVAVDALGADKVHCVMMPSKYTSGESLGDAEACAKALGVNYQVIPIKAGVDALDSMLADSFEGCTPDTTEENIQSRLRAVTLMALSNKFGHMVLTTGNKSEMSVGYATLYGDMCGGYNPLKDVYKMDVFALSRWRNENVPAGGLGPSGEVIPVNIIDKPPTAELREDQKDEDSLPPYPDLDDMLHCLVDQEMSVSEVISRGYDASVVARIEHLLYIAEYKRRQAPPGVKITKKNFGRDRRYPITNGFRSARK
ncbi:NAD+ synthase [Kordiimonas sediminis]|uniref:Glutamine-dependent NAD(+) synthetase n=1 Tax=Kordiimonas sediminis TaxID=1735581 RepID=A0A919AY72_9PROT|nr:NAD+ synthase [Kordiimonas sediminis]GHF29229.1 NAD+ synthase [Kordiimonas sediminis]